MTNVTVDGVKYRPVNEEKAAAVARRLRDFSPEATTYFRDLFIKNDTAKDGSLYGMYDEGDEEAPFFSEAFLYNLLGKDDARSVLGIVRQLAELAGVEYR